VAYIGTQITAGNYRKLTNLASSFNGVTTTFTLSVPPGTSPYYVTPTSTYQLLISVGGIIQQPDTDYTVSTNTITFTTAPAAGLSFFGILMGDALNIGTPSDGTVTTAKLLNGSVTTEKLASPISPAVSSLNGGQIGGNRNRIINGDMDTDQRNAGAAQTFTAAAALAYSVDRWYGYSTGANVTGQRVQGATAGQFRYRFTGAASVTAIGFGQRIEQLNSADFAGTTATLSVDLANSLLTTVTWTAFYANTADTFGTLASPTRTQIATGTFTVNSTVTRYSTNISVPAAATTGIEIVFTVGAQTSGTWTIGNVQLEPGTVATPLERRSYGQELALCQRYYQEVAGDYAGYLVQNDSVFWTTSFCVSMRVSPTIVFSGYSLVPAQTTLTTGVVNTNAITVYLNSGANGNLTPARSYATSGKFTASAEL
jgi:hypothetical protein